MSQVELDIAGHVEIEPPIQVVIEENGTGAEARVIDAGPGAHLKKLPLPVFPQSIRPPAGEEQVRVSIVIVISYGNPSPPAIEFNPQLAREFMKSPCGILPEKSHSRALDNPAVYESPGIRKEQVQPSVAIRIEHPDPGPDILDNHQLLGPSGNQDPVQSPPNRDIDEADPFRARRRLLAGAGRQKPAKG
jgi:hypothetical protein